MQGRARRHASARRNCDCRAGVLHREIGPVPVDVREEIIDIVKRDEDNQGQGEIIFVHQLQINQGLRQFRLLTIRARQVTKSGGINNIPTNQ